MAIQDFATGRCFSQRFHFCGVTTRADAHVEREKSRHQSQVLLAVAQGYLQVILPFGQRRALALDHGLDL